MSASPQRFNLVPQSTRSEAQPTTEIEGRESELLTQVQNAIQAGNRARLYATLGIVVTFAAGVVAGYFLYLLWEQVGAHDGQLVQQQISIQRLAANQSSVSTQVERLGALDNSVESLRAQLEMQSRKLNELEKGQNGARDQMAGMIARWQRELRELSKTKTSASAMPTPAPGSLATTDRVTPQLSAAPPVPAPSAQPSAEKHNETFSADLKPTPNAYAQMSPSGLVVWMTPRPGFAKPVPASVIGHVRGLGMLVHNWDDNNHYFITESGSWILDQR